MRINLKTPFAEKDAAKALGARWDGAQKLWYITDVADLTPFMRWIPDVQAATQDPAASAVTPGATAKVPARQSPGVITRPSTSKPPCGCSALPWDNCSHTTGA
jgi:hypothetical protein